MGVLPGLRARESFVLPPRDGHKHSTVKAGRLLCRLSPAPEWDSSLGQVRTRAAAAASLLYERLQSSFCD